MEDELERRIADEVRRQMTSLAVRIEEVSRNLLALYRNGSGGPPGYLEVARAEDDRRFEEKERRDDERFAALLQKIDALQAEALRQEGKDQLRKEMQATRIELEKLRDLKKTGMFTRLHAIVALAASLFGAYFWPFVHHLLHIQ